MLERFKISPKLWKQFDFVIFITSVIIVIFGTMNIYSASKYFNGSNYYLKTQLAAFALSLAIGYIILVFDYSVIQSYANIIYWFGIALLVINDTVFKHFAVNGAASWIKLGKFSFQPSELAKLGMIIMLAKKINDMEGNINNRKNLLILIFYAVLPMILIIIQPDAGMMMVCFFIVLGIFIAAKLNYKIIIGGFAGIALLLAVVWNSSLMQGYWKDRIESFIYPEKYELSTSLQQTRSKIGIGSGGVFGDGYMKGYIQSGMVPETSTDFIFSVVGSEWGLAGGLFLLTLYAILLTRFLKIAKSSKDIFGSMICVGVFSSFLFSIFQNIGMTIGLLPITGITLPLMSRGGSSMVTNFMAIALVLNIGMRKKKINF